jgi:hypothetical protein
MSTEEALRWRSPILSVATRRRCGTGITPSSPIVVWMGLDLLSGGGFLPDPDRIVLRGLDFDACRSNCLVREALRQGR